MNKGILILVGVLLVALAAGMVFLNRLGEGGDVSRSTAAEAAGLDGGDSSEGNGAQPQRGLSAPAVVPHVNADPALSQGYGSKKSPLSSTSDVDAGEGSVGAGESKPHTLYTSYQMEPIALNFDRGPFQKRDDGRVLKMDTVAYAATINQEESSTEEDIGVLGSLIDQYRRIFGANPIAGDNRDLVRAMTGDNPHKLALIDPANPAISPDGELIDRWGTPFRFHAVDSRMPMEIYSAGPDARFGSPDDVMLDEPVVIGPEDFSVDDSGLEGE